MNGPEHYRRAERCIEQADGCADGDPLSQGALARAQVHATLALAAATALQPREFLTTEYLSLRLQLWALAQAHEDFAQINITAQQRYRGGLAALISAARPGLSASECATRAADIDVVQNGIWLTALLGLDHASIHRSVTRCEEIALAP